MSDDIRRAVETRNWGSLLQVINRQDSELAALRAQVSGVAAANAGLEVRCNRLEAALNALRVKMGNALGVV